MPFVLNASNGAGKRASSKGSLRQKTLRSRSTATHRRLYPLYSFSFLFLCARTECETEEEGFEWFCGSNRLCSRLLCSAHLPFCQLRLDPPSLRRRFRPGSLLWRAPQRESIIESRNPEWRSCNRACTLAFLGELWN